MNKLLKLMLSTTIMATGAMASDVQIGANIDFSNGGNLNIKQNAELMPGKNIILGKTADGNVADGKILKNSGMITINPTIDSALTINVSGTDFYQYIYISNTSEVKRVWSTANNLTEPGSEMFAATATTTGTTALTDYDSGFQQVMSAKGLFQGQGVIDQNYSAATGEVMTTPPGGASGTWYKFTANDGKLYAYTATDFPSTGQTLENGVYISSDSGSTWNPVTTGTNLSTIYSALTLKGNVVINSALTYNTTGGNFLDQDKVDYSSKTTQEQTFLSGKTPKAVLSNGNSGGRFDIDILNPEVMAKIQYNDGTLYTFGETSKNNLRPDRLKVTSSADKDQVNAYLKEFGVTANNLAVNLTVGDDIITTLMKANDTEAVTLPKELGNQIGKIDISMPATGTGNAFVPIVASLHNIAYTDETLNFIAPDNGTSKTLKLSGDNKFLGGNITFGTADKNVPVEFAGENSIPGGITKVNGELNVSVVNGVTLAKDANLTATKNISGSKISALQGSVFNIGE